MKEETLNKIDRYLRGEMTDREKNAFENILAGDDALRQRVELMKDIIDAVETRAMKEHLVALDCSTVQAKQGLQDWKNRICFGCLFSIGCFLFSCRR